MPKTPLTDAFLDDLKTKLDSLKITRTALALEIGTSKQTLNRWLHNTRKPTGEFILKIQEFLRVPPP